MEKRKGTFFAIYLAYFLDYFGYALVFGIFGPLLLDPDSGMFDPDASIKSRNIALGILFAVYPLIQFITAPIFGEFADHFGRKKTFYIIGFGAMCGYFLSGIAIYFCSFPMLLVSRFITGAFSSHRGVCMASLSDLSPDEQSRSKSYGILSTIGGVSWIISILFGGFISEKLNPSMPFWMTTILCTISLGAIHLFFHESHQTTESFTFDPWKGIKHIHSCFKVKGLRSLYTFYLMLMMGWGINLLWLNPYTLSRYGVSNQTLFLLLSSTGVMWSLGSFVLNKFFLKYFKSQEIAWMGCLGLLIIFTICSFANSISFFTVCALLASIFGSLVWPNALSTISLSAPEGVQGKVMGISQSFGSFALLLAPLMAGIAASINIFYVYPMAAVLILIALGTLSYAYYKQPKVSQ